MKMVLRIIIFGVFLFGTVLLERTILLPKNIILPDFLFCGWLFCAYLLLLYLEIRSRIPKATSQKELRWVGFHFTFWAGFFWSVFVASPGSDSWFVHPLNFFGLLAGCILGGIIFGILGMAITQFMLLLIFKLTDQANEDKGT